MEDCPHGVGQEELKFKGSQLQVGVIVVEHYTLVSAPLIPYNFPNKLLVTDPLEPVFN